MVLTLLPLAFGLKDESLVVIMPSRQCDYSFVKPTPDMNQLSVFMSSAFLHLLTNLLPVQWNPTLRTLLKCGHLR